MEIDITLSVILKKATLECSAFLDEIMHKYKIPEDLEEIILEKLLLKEREKKLNLYSSALLKEINKKDMEEEN